MNWKTLFLMLLSALLLCPAALAESALPLVEADMSRFAANPRNVKDIGDPFIAATEDGYAMFATGGPIGFNVWRSADLKTFAKEKALKKLSWSAGDYWAPEVWQWDGRWVMLYTTRWKENNSLRIGVAFADAVEGPYEDPIGGPLFDFGYAAIDGTLVVDENGTPYMIYSRDCSENVYQGRNESHLYGVQLAADLCSTVGEPVLITQPNDAWELASGDWRWNEGPAVVTHGGKYYLFYSANCYSGKEYSVGVAVADAPLGPYVKQANNPLLTWVEKDGQVLVSGPGHNAFFYAGDELFTAYHTHTYPNAPSGNRQLCVDRAGFHADGTAYINGPTLAPQLLPLKDLGLVDHMTAATPAADADALLADGDYCLTQASDAYIWQGERASFTWGSAVTADMLVIYPAKGQAVSGTVTVNGALSAAFSLTGDEPAGASAVLAFEEQAVTSLEIALDAPGALGEVLLLGR